MKKNTKLFLLCYSVFLLSIIGLVFIFKNTGIGTLIIQSFLNRDLVSIAIIGVSLIAVGVGLKYCIDKDGLLPLKKA